MPIVFLILFIAFPVLEIASLIEIGRRVGLLLTLLLVAAGVFIGVALIRSQSFMVAGRLMSAMREGQSPAVPLAHSGFLVIAGILFIVPGFFSDALAVLLLLPPVRVLLASRISGHVQVWRSERTPEPPKDRGSNRDPGVIDVEFSEVDPRKDDRDKPGPPKMARRDRHSPWGRNP